MVDFKQDFLLSINHAMLYEVGKFWDPTDLDVIQGNIQTKDSRKKCGYVNIPQDNGGETKYGIAQKHHPELQVATLNLDQAFEIYYNEYWLKSKCDKLTFPLQIIHLDGAINHGVGRANRFLQQAAGVTDDGIIGPQTLSIISTLNQIDIINHISELRKSYYANIVKNNPTQSIFLNGWKTRIQEVTDYCLNHTD